MLHDYPVAGRRGVFSSGEVQLLDGATILEARADPRASFASRRRRDDWSALDALYFFGYALAYDQALPFSLAVAQPLSLRHARSSGRPLWGVDVDLPAESPTHSRCQTFFFDDAGLLRRNDFVLEIAGWWASCAQQWDDYVDVAGLAVARRRRIVARLGRFERAKVVLDLSLADVVALPVAAPAPPRLSLV
jgi:hypothetical protein